MGAENSVLEGCSWEDELVCPTGFPWKLSPITKSDGTEGVVFQARKSDRKDSELLQTCAKTLLRLRHPNVVRFLGSGNSSKGCWMATEPVAPILSSLSEITSEELAAGVLDILQALDFMHSKLGVCHNNVCPSSVFISKDGGWKLGGMEHSCKFQEATPQYLESRRVFRDEASLSPEEKAGQLRSELSLGHARDMFAIGALVDVLMDLVKVKDNLLRELEQQITICVAVDPSQRPTASNLLKQPVFNSDLVSLITFVRNVTLKTEKEKTEFFSHLLPKLQNLPEDVIARRMVVPLLSRFVLLEEVAQTHVLPYILVPRKDSSLSKDKSYDDDRLLSESLYQQYVIPHLCNIFRVHDCHIRTILLKYFSTYVHLFTREQLEEEIFLQILLGVRDSDDSLVAASLKALADLVPILGGDYVVGGPRKNFFFHGLPKQVTLGTESSVNGPLNVSSVLSKAVPPLLKDIASGVNNNAPSFPVSAEERERKMKERQQKRDEARLKREERRRKLKEKQLQEAEESSDRKQKLSVGEETFSTPTIEEIAGNEEGQKDGVVFGDGGESLKKQQDGTECLDENVEKEASDWSDWEDPDGNISDEIEEELRRMSSAESAAVENKVQTSPSPYMSVAPPSPPPMTSDWSDMPEADRTTLSLSQKSATSLYSQEENTSELHLPADKASMGDTTIVSSPSANQSYHGNGHVGGMTSLPRTSGKSLKLKSSSSSSSSTSAKASVKPHAKKNVNDLGFGYDIKSIEINKSAISFESDLFADMAPTISLSSTNAVDILNSGEATGLSEMADKSKDEPADSVNSKKTSSPSALFAMDSTTVAEETSGWGADDDLDWGNDNF